MQKFISRKTCILFVSLLFMTAFAVHFPSTCYGQEPCLLPLEVDVSPYQVNIDSGGVEHYVRILTYAWYSNTTEAFVYINESEEPIEPYYIVLTRDSVGHLVVKIDLVALQDAELEVDTYHDLKICVELEDAIDGCSEKEGTGEIYIIGKKGA